MPSNSYYSDFEYHVPEFRKKLKCPKLSIIFLPQKTKGQKWYEINSSNSGRPSIVWYTSDLLSRFWQDIQKIIFFFRFLKKFSYWKYMKTVKSMIMNIKFSEFWYKKHKIWVVAADRDMVEILSFELCFFGNLLERRKEPCSRFCEEKPPSFLPLIWRLLYLISK